MSTNVGKHGPPLKTEEEFCLNAQSTLKQMQAFTKKPVKMTAFVPMRYSNNYPTQGE